MHGADIMRELIEDIRPHLTAVMEDLGVDETSWIGLLSGATDASHADVAMPCHSLARVMDRSPAEISNDLAEMLGSEINGICHVSSVNGFLNFTVSVDWMQARINLLRNDETIGVECDSKSRIVAIDYSSPNVAKRMHVGHLRSTVIGDALNRMLTYKGHKVLPENHIGDWGTPFGMLIEHYLEDYDSIEDIDLLTFYKEARVKFDSDSSFADRSRQRVVLLQSKDPETQDLWTKLLDHSMEEFNVIYKKLGVLLEGEEPWGESRYQSHLPIVLERLERTGLLEHSEGAEVVFPQGWVNREGNPLPMIIRKADGGFNYSATDLACIIIRVEERKCDEILYVVGQEQKQHFEMVFQVAREAGFMDDSIKAVHIPFGLVLGADGKKMASRAGVAVDLIGVLEDAVEKAKDAIIEKNPDLEDLDNVATKVGIGAVKYADLSTERTNNYVFDWDKMLSFEGNTSPYLQYAHARICSIFRRSGINRKSVRSSPIVIEHEDELSLAQAISCFSEELDNSIDNYSPHLLCTYLHSLASAFASFYESCPVLAAEDEATMNSRLALCDLAARTLSTGLDLLGIDSLEQM